MAVPTITSITPSTGLGRGGYFIKIIGTNFNIEHGVRVEFGKAGFTYYRAEKAYATEEIEIVVAPPRFRWPILQSDNKTDAFPFVVDIKVSNLDENGDVIAGEVVEESSAFTYTRKSFASKTRLTWLMEVLMYRHAQEYTDNVVTGVKKDYTFDGDKIAFAHKYGCILDDPEWREHKKLRYVTDELTCNADGTIENSYLGDAIGIVKRTTIDDITIDVILYHKSKQALYNMMDEYKLFLAANRMFGYPSTIDDMDSELVKYPLMLDEDFSVVLGQRDYFYARAVLKIIAFPRGDVNDQYVRDIDYIFDTLELEDINMEE